MSSRMNAGLGYGAEDIEEFEDIEYFGEDMGDEGLYAGEDDEGFESDDEGAESYDEGFESDDEGAESYDEGAEAYDEALESYDEAVHDDEAAESDDESTLTLRERRQQALRARMDRQRAAARARALQMQQRAAAQRAAAAQGKLAQRLKGIPVVRSVGAHRIGVLSGSGVVTARLPNGRTTQMMLTPPLATRRDINLLMRRVSDNDLRQAKATAAQGKAIQQLKATQSAAVKTLTAQQLKLGKDLAKRIADSDTKLDKRISKEVLAQTTALREHRQQMQRALRLQRQRSTWNSVLLASALPLYAAYGERENPFSKTNLILTGSLAFWLFGDDLMGRFLGGESKSGKAWARGATWWSYLAPVGNWATVWYFLHNGQHERFIAGIKDMSTASENVSLLEHIGDDYEAEFKKNYSKVPAIATVVSGANSVTAIVTDQGELKLTLDAAPAAGNAARVAWAVDTKKP